MRMRVFLCLWLISSSLLRWRLSRPALLMLLSMVPKERHPPAGERWQLRRSGRGFSLVRQQPVPTDQGRLPRQAALDVSHQAAGGCTVRLRVNFGDFGATGLLSTATSNPDR